MTRQSYEELQVNVEAGKVDTFTDRLVVAIKLAGGATNMAFKANVSTSVLSKWKTGKSEPQLTSLVNMARAAVVSVGWLATGEGPMIEGDRVAEEPMPFGASDAPTVDLDALEEVITKTRRMLQERGVRLRLEAEAKVIRLIYEYYIRHAETMDDATLDNVIQLAAFR